MKNGSTRRQFTVAAATAAMAHPTSADTDDQKMRSPNTIASSGDLDPVKWTQERYRSAPLRLTFRATTKAEAEAWQPELRTKLSELLGGFPERILLESQTLDIKQYSGYRRERVLFLSRPGVAVTGYLLTPNQRKPPYPTVIAVPGHGRGADDIVGLDEYGRDRTGDPGYQADFAIQAVQHGLAAFAIEPMCFGQRRDP